MRNKIINGLGICFLLAASIGAFFSIYLRRMPEKMHPPLPEQQMHPPLPEKPLNAQPTQLPPYIRVGILGESNSNGSENPFNKKVVIKLFEVMKNQKVQAVFVTGDLVYGWLKSLSPPTEDAGVYSSESLRQQLSKFARLFKKILGDTAELYPLMGAHEAIGPDAAKIFREVFDVPDTIPPNNNFIAYAVSMGNTFFANVPTDYYLTQPDHPTQSDTIPSEALKWLKNTLAHAAHNHRFLFVLGHEPAYTTPTLSSHSHGLDQNPKQRDALWEILRDNNVLAYFASREHLYDRTNRYGVWQVISGGGGALLVENSKLRENAFFHCLVLTLPQNDKEMPSVKVFDTDGKIRDEFELKVGAELQPLYQMRISSLFI